MRDIVINLLPYLADDLAANAQLSSAYAGHDTLGRGDNGNANTRKHPRDVRLFGVDAASRFADTFQTGKHGTTFATLAHVFDLEAQKLLNWGYTAFEAVKLFDPGQAVVTPKVWKGSENTVKLGRNEAIIVALPVGSAARLKTAISRVDPLMAPLSKGQQAAVLKISVGDQSVLDVPLLALEGVAQAGIVGRAWDALRLWIK